MMRPKLKTVSFKEITPHVVMGAGLGTFLSLALIAANQMVFQILSSSEWPRVAVVGFVGVWSLAIGVCSGITGFIFSRIEKD